MVDNGSRGNIENHTQRFDHVRAVKEPRSGSYAARNKGIAVSRGEILAFTDSDCIPTETWLTNGVAHLLKTPGCGIVGGRVALFFQKDRRPNTVELFESLTYFQQKLNVETVGFSVTANLFTFKNIFASVGLFDDRLKSGGDLDWGQRVSANGYRLFYAEDTRVYHPARHRLRQLYRKVIRVTGGRFERERQQASLRQVVLTVLATDILPPVTRIRGVWNNDQIRKPGLKIKLIALLLFLKYAVVWEKLRLQFGAESQRS